MEAYIGNLFFTSKFDSGNLARVEEVDKPEEAEHICEQQGFGII